MRTEEVERGIAPFSCELTPLESTLADHLVSVDSKRLTQTLSALDATLTINRGGVAAAFR